MATRKELPEKVEGHWGAVGFYAHVSNGQLSMPRDTIALGHIADFGIANAVYLDPSIMYLTAAKERIRWLSVQLALANQLVERVANLHGPAGEIGAGMLADLVEHAKELTNER